MTSYGLIDLDHHEVMLEWVAIMTLHEPMMTYICRYHSGVSGLDSVQNIHVCIQLCRCSHSDVIITATQEYREVVTYHSQQQYIPELVSVISLQ